jgi:hypothetical protein
MGQQDSSRGRINAKKNATKNEVKPLAAERTSRVDDQKPDTKMPPPENTKMSSGKIDAAAGRTVVPENSQKLNDKSNAVASSAVNIQSAETAAPNATGGSLEKSGSSAFSRENILNSLQQMVKSSSTDCDAAAQGRDNSDIKVNAMKEKQTSALELAVAMYMAANEFYDGGYLWCRSCDRIFGDISALCRHVHSDQHQLVSLLFVDDSRYIV